MSSIDRNDSWNNDNDFLSGALHGAADQMPGGEVDDLNVSFGVVRDRVRRRRAAKIGGLAGASLALVGVLAFGVTQGPLLDRAGPVPPGQSESATPSPSGSPSQAPEPGPTGPPATSVIRDGHVPSWLDGMGLTCGMPAGDLGTTASGWSIASSGDIYGRTFDQGEPSWGMAATVEPGDGSLDVPPVLVWSQDGVVVDLGTNTFESPEQREPLIGGGQEAIEAQGGAMTTCAPTDGEAGDRYETPLPEGEYQVRVVAFPETPSGQWDTTVVSQPVAVRLDAEGAHTVTGTRGGEATIEPPAPADGELTRMVLDRTTEWVTAEMTQRDYDLGGGALSVTARCESADPADTVPFEVVLPTTSEVLDSGEITCDAAETEVSLGDLGGSEAALDLRLGSVPDGVARLWAVLAPGGGDAGEAAGECSASSLDLEYDPASTPSAAAGETAQTLVAAAKACDSEQLIELATEHGTQLMFTTETPEQVFGLPEVDTLPYERVVRLLAGTGGVVSGGNAGNGTIVWPRVSTPEFRDSDEAWAEVVSAGLLTQAEADTQRADETFGYTGMVIGIDGSGIWRYYEPSQA